MSLSLRMYLILRSWILILCILVLHSSFTPDRQFSSHSIAAPPSPQDPPALPYLTEKNRITYDIPLQVALRPDGESKACHFQVQLQVLVLHSVPASGTSHYQWVQLKPWRSVGIRNH